MEQKTKQEEFDYMFELGDKLCQLRDEKKRAEAVVKGINKEIAATENEITDMMIERDAQSFAHGGKLFSIRCTPRWTAVAEYRDKLFNALLDMDRRDILTVSSGKLPGFITEQAALYAEEHPIDNCGKPAEKSADEDDSADGEDEKVASPSARLPEWLGELVQCYGQVGIQVRKTSTKALKAAKAAKKSNN